MTAAALGLREEGGYEKDAAIAKKKSLRIVDAPGIVLVLVQVRVLNRAEDQE